MKILISGDRNWTNHQLIASSIIKEILDLKLEYWQVTLIHGCARGADTLAGKIARHLGMKVLEFPAEWDKYGKSAGPIRNRQMLNEKPDLVLAFHNDIGNSKGTKDCILEANKRKINVKLISE